MSAKRSHIAFIVPYPTGVAPSQRFRFEQFLPELEKAGFTWDIHPFLEAGTWDYFYKPGNTARKAVAILKGYLRRYLLLFQLRKYDKIYVHREFGPVFYPLLAWITRFLLRRKFIFDLDDAIWLPNHSEGNRLFRFLKRPSNANLLMSWSEVNVCGNEYLRQHALQFNPNAVLIPTTIDTERIHNRINTHDNTELTVGWTGSHSTIRYLEALEPVLRQLEQKFSFKTRVISDLPPALDLKGLEFIRWNADTEAEDLLPINIGLMPLPEDPWTKGKCGLKALQYMALGIPVLLSPVGVNTSLIEDGEHGYFCRNHEDWRNRLETLLTQPELVKQLGARTRERVESTYSTRSNAPKFILLFAN